MNRLIGIGAIVLGLGFMAWGTIQALTLLASSHGRVTVTAVESATITPTTFSLSGAPGETKTQLFSVANTGNKTQTFLFSVVETCVGSPWGASVSPASISPFPGDSGGVTLSVPIPLTAQGGTACDYDVRVEADTASPPPP